MQSFIINTLSSSSESLVENSKRINKKKYDFDSPEQVYSI